MLLDGAAIDKLIDFGMTEREAKLYLALLTKPEFTAPDLHRLSGVPRTKIYESLQSMVARGFCQERSAGRNKYYTAVRPSRLKDTLLSVWERSHVERRLSAESLFGELETIFQHQVELDPSLDQLEIIRSAEQVHQFYIKLNTEATQEVLTFNRSPYACVNEKLLAEQEVVVKDVLNRGVVLKTIYMLEGKHWSWLYGHLQRSRDEGEEPRVHPDLPLKMFIFDRRKVMLALPSIKGRDSGDFTMLIVEDPGFVTGCTILFNTLWEQSYTPEEWNSIESTKEPAEPTPLQDESSISESVTPTG